MDDVEMFNILRTCIIGGAYEACGVGFDPDDSMDVYHLEDFDENVDPDDITGLYTSPGAFLEMECVSNSQRIYETIYLMETSWNIGKKCFHKEWQIPIGKKLWNIGKNVAIQYVSTYGEEDDIRKFVNMGEDLFVN